MSEVTPTNARGAMLGAYQLLVNQTYRPQVCESHDDSLLSVNSSPLSPSKLSPSIHQKSIDEVSTRNSYSEGESSSQSPPARDLGSAKSTLISSVWPHLDCFSFQSPRDGMSLKARLSRQRSHWAASMAKSRITTSTTSSQSSLKRLPMGRR